MSNNSSICKPAIITCVILLTAIIAGAIHFNYKETGVDKQAVITIPSCVKKYPDAYGYVNDFEGIFSPEETLILDSMMNAYEKKTTNQLAVLTVDSAILGRCSLYEYSLGLANYWGVGKKNMNNGIMMAICTQLQKISIQNGSGIEKILSNKETAKILNEQITPQFAEGKYFEGTKAGLLALIKKTSLK